MSAPATPAPPSKETTETRILRAAYDDGESDLGELARLVAEDQEALAYVVKLYDTLCALHGATREPIPSRAMARLDSLLDEAMVLMAAG